MENLSEKTIVAISTALMPSGLSVIRLSGNKAKDIAEKIFVSYTGRKISTTKGYHSLYGYIKNESRELLDDVVVAVFCSPHSYTGEDVIEISCHGGVLVSRKILKLLLKNGATLAQPGEFTKRAFLNNKMDLTRAEAVIDVINASSEKAVRLATNTYKGSLYSKVKALTDEMSEQCAHLDVWADYPDEEVDEINSDDLLSSLERFQRELTQLVANYDNGRLIKDGVNTAIVGKPNVGKSTFMNLLSGFERSIVTDIPGTTRDTVEERITISDIVLNLSDTAGIRDTENIVEQIGVKRAMEKIKEADLVLALFDYSDILSEKDREIIENLKSTKTIALINKTDLDKKLDCEYIEKNIENVVYISAKEEKGIDDFKTALRKLFDFSFSESSDALMVNERQRQAIILATENINKAIEAIKLSFTLDAVTVCIEEAVQALLELTGEKVSAVVVDKIFSKFCVGK